MYEVYIFPKQKGKAYNINLSNSRQFSLSPTKSSIFMILSVLAKWMIRLANPEKMVEKSQIKAIKLWNSKNSKIESYKEKNSKRVKTIEDFKKVVPISSKKTVFESYSLNQLVSSKLKNIDFIMMSSGSSTKFSIGVLTHKEMKKAAQNTDLFMQLFFGAQKNKTLIINASSMGVRVFSNFVISDTGPRPDIVIGLLKKVAPFYDKTFIIADPIFIKLMVEESIEIGFNWDNLNAYFISGGEWMPETLRTYVHHLTGKSPSKPEKGYWVGTYGLTELGYPLFFETAELVSHRSKLSMLSAISRSQYKTETLCTTPFVFYYRASSYYLETIKNEKESSRLVFTTLDKNRLIPIFRYDTGDVGEIIEKDELQFDKQAMPLVRFWGRDKNYLVNGNSKIHISDIKELLFFETDLINLITGFFTLSNNKKHIQLSVQLKKNKTITDIEKQALSKLIHSFYPAIIEIQFVAYHDMKYQMELDFERKFYSLIQ